jgi:hypothetical protein
MQASPPSKAHELRARPSAPPLRVLHAVPLDSARQHSATILRLVEALPITPDGLPAQDHTAPVLLIPRVLESELCRGLIALYEQTGGQDSGFTESDPATGRTVGVIDHRRKRRRDCEILDETLQREVKQRIERRVLQAISRAFCFNATRTERYLIEKQR